MSGDTAQLPGLVITRPATVAFGAAVTKQEKRFDDSRSHRGRHVK
jgi:hypothetical protein